MSNITWREHLDAYQITAEVEHGMEYRDKVFILLAESMQTAVFMANSYLGAMGSVKKAERIGRAIVPIGVSPNEGNS